MDVNAGTILAQAARRSSTNVLPSCSATSRLGQVTRTTTTLDVRDWVVNVCPYVFPSRELRSDGTRGLEFRDQSNREPARTARRPGKSWESAPVLRGQSESVRPSRLPVAEPGIVG
jgi:hypothetical protein